LYLKRTDPIFLITNWHNVTGRRNDTGQCISDTLAVPDLLATYFRRTERVDAANIEYIRLYSDDQMLEPTWYEHPKHGRAVDVVALPLHASLAEKYRFFPMNTLGFDTGFDAEVADDAFVVGYPFAELSIGVFPIWKRASIASEPGIDLDNLPKMFIDTATRPGFSGSPIIMQRIGIHGNRGEPLTGNEIIGRIHNFIGIYSGRVDRETEKAQLGIVWKARVIDEIIDAAMLGKSPILS
jgi:hypothetical protein